MIREHGQFTPEQTMLNEGAETITSSSQLVCSRKEFDRRVKIDPNLRKQIAGFSSLSLHHIQMGITPEGYSIPLFSDDDGGCVYADIRAGVHRAAIGYDYHYDRFEHQIRANRRDFGLPAAIIEYIMQQPYAPENYQMLDNEDSVNDFTFKVIALRRHKISMSRAISELSDEVKKTFPTEKDLKDALRVLQQRGGVQAIYGGRREFIEFLGEKEAFGIDDCSVEIHSPIPSRLVIAVVPLGRYEEKVLLKA